jgi:CspA family cold shock protein
MSGSATPPTPPTPPGRPGRPGRDDTPVVTQGTGTVKWFNADKGFGFVAPDDGSRRNLFVHVNTVRKAGLAETLSVGHAVSYTVTSTRGRDVITEIAPKQ